MLYCRLVKISIFLQTMIIARAHVNSVAQAWLLIEMLIGSETRELLLLWMILRASYAP